ncbi:endo-1,4-beta-xylanase [Paenibacillus sp. PL2-23]|uniref:endo-1,4-beta-xylanase n=1 Tax=Paenibacillus sp. PL2-23 TaxID=2100729 RepID=UPI0030FC0B3D
MNRKLKPILSLLLAFALLLPSGWLAPAAGANQSAGTVVLSQSFEDDSTGGWGPVWGGTGNVAISTTVASDGAKSLQFSGRTARSHSPSLNLTSIMQSGKTYDVSLKVRLGANNDGSSSSDTLHIASKVNSPMLQNIYPWLIGDQAVTSGVWTTFEVKNYEVPAGTTEFVIWVESVEASQSTADIYIDEVLIKDVTPAPSTTVLSQSFEDDSTGGWGPVWGGTGNVAVSTTVASEGSKSLQFSGRAARSHSPSLNLTSIMQSGKTYDVSLKVRLGANNDGSSSSDTLHIASKVNSPMLQTIYPWLIEDQAVTSDVWTTFEVKNYEVPAGTTEFVIWVESVEASQSTADIYIDEVLIKDVTPGATPDEGNLDQTGINADFENGIGAWAIRSTEGNGQIAATTAANHTTGGSSSLEVTVSTQYNGPILDVMSKMHKGHRYHLSAWVRMASGQTATSLRISVQSGDSTFTNVSANVSATDSQWVELSGDYTVATTPSVLKAYVETAQNPGNPAGSPVTFYMDDFTITHLGAVAAPKPIQNITPIKDVYQDDFLIGTAVGDAEFEGLRLELLKKHHNVVTAENAMKPDYAYNGAREFDFTAEDALVAKIKEQGLLLHGHVLVWHQQMPTWLSSDAAGNPLDEAEALANLTEHITTVVEHFGDDVISWDVVNEAMNDNPPNPANWKASLRNSPWKAALGEDYVEQSFRIAKEVIKENSWDIKLYYNDYNDDNKNKSTAIANMVKEINEKYAAENNGELLIDGIGMQAHYNLNTKPDNVEESLKRFIDLGVEVSITEIDITAGTDSVLTEKQAKQQGYLYAQLMNLYREYKDDIARVTFWGLNDATSWRASQNPLLFDKDLQAKPAYYGVIDPDTFIAENPPTATEANQSSAKYGTPVIDGTIDSIWSETAAMPINKFQMAWQGASGSAKALWDENNLYVLFQVNNAELDKSSANAWEQDSVEVFLDQNNGKSTSYQADDGQYRVNYDNEASFNPPSIADGFESATKVIGSNYTVELKIPLTAVTPAHNVELGFDVQINDGKAGARQSAASWNDTTGQGYQDTSVFGVLKLTTDSIVAPTHPIVTVPSPPAGVEATDGGAVIKPVAKVEGNRVIGQISSDSLKKALELAARRDGGKKQIAIEVPKQANALAYEIELPAQSLNGEQHFTLQMKTEHATLNIPSNMLSGKASNAPISIRVAKASTEGMNAAAREQIGDRPVLDLNVYLGNEQLEWNNPEAPVIISVPYVPTEGELAQPNAIVVWYIAGNGDISSIPNGRYDAASGTVIFHTTHFSTYAVASVVTSFDDLAGVPWANQAIDAMAARDVIRGTAEHTFSPTAAMKRGDFIALLVRALELQSAGADTATFIDVKASAYYHQELAIAQKLGIATGFEDGTFRPDQSLSRQDMMVLTARAAAAAGKTLEGDGSLEGYADVSSLSAYAVASAASLSQSGIVNGKNGKLAPHESLTRAEAAVILYRIWGLQD